MQINAPHGAKYNQERNFPLSPTYLVNVASGDMDFRQKKSQSHANQDR